MDKSRRTLLQAGALWPLASLLSGCLRHVPVCPLDPKWTTPGAGLAIDAHSHIFNASDLQVREFVTRVAARQTSGGLAKLAKYLGGLLQTLGWNAAPGASGELDMLAKLAKYAPKCPDLPTEIDQQRSTQYSRAVAEMKDATARRRAQRAVGRSPEEDAGLDAVDALPNTYADFSTQRRAARTAATPESAERASIGSAIEFVVEMFQYRYGSAFKLLETYNTNARKLDLLIAHLVDYDWWLAGGKSTKTTLAQQVEVMSAISVVTGGRVHAFVPFCPLREVQYRKDPRSTFSSLELVRTAITSGGAVGVKLYPPMGFAPYGNGTVVDPAIWKSSSWLPPVVKEPKFGEQLDAALLDLYTWCASEEVPVMAHANPSNGASTDFEALAGPAYWALALKAVPGLRASFGHFGAVLDRSDSHSNAEAFLALMLADANAPGARAFADSGYFSEALDKPQALEDALVALFTSDAAHNKTLASRFMLGTDWKMLVLENGADQYLSDIDTIMNKVAARLASIGDYSKLQEGFSGQNAAAFLGLRPGEKTRKRLDDFYAKNKVKDPAWAGKVHA